MLPSVTLRQLTYLVALADLGHFGRAAERCLVTQPNLSNQLKALEDGLGVALVERSRRSVVFTPLGREIVSHARRVLRDVDDLVDRAARERGILGGILHLGVNRSLGPYLLPRLWPALRQSYPDLTLYPRENMPRGIIEGLRAGDLDAAVMSGPVEEPDLESLEVFSEPLFLAVPADHRLAGRTAVRRGDLAGLRILVLDIGHHLRDVVQEVSRAHGATLDDRFGGTSIEMLRQIVGSGNGACFLSGLYVLAEALEDRQIRLLPLRPALARPIQLVWRRASPRGPEFKAFGQIVRDVAEPLMRQLPDRLKHAS